MKLHIYAFIIILIAFFIATAEASPVSYAAELSTTKGNPVTNVLILEEDQVGAVHGTVYGSEVPGNGQVVISHNPPFTPVRSLIIGLSDGQDAEGNDKVQIIMFLDPAFADSIHGVKWSEVFPPTHHSTATASLISATAGDPSELAWFTDYFFSGPAAPAVFDTGSPFVIGEFTGFDQIGSASAAGPWILNSPIVLLPQGAIGTVASHPTAVVDETAVNRGPYDIRLTLSGFGTFAFIKTVTNHTNLTWQSFTVRLGTGLGEGFVDSTTNPNMFFVNQPAPTETTGAFPDVVFGLDEIVFNGELKPGRTAIFQFVVQTDQSTTVRQNVVGEAVQRPVSVPVMPLYVLVLLILGLLVLARRSINSY